MASAYGIVHQYGEPQSTFDPQLAAGVLEARQNKFDTNVVKVEQTLGQLGLSMAMLARDKDKKYMYEKMSSLVNSVNNLEGTDFSSNESTRSILSTVNEALDGEVIKQLGESKKIRDFQQGIQSRIEAEDGSYSDLNYQDAMQNADYDKYMNGETESLKSFNYVPYVDKNRELLARIKEAKEVIGKRTVETILPDGSVSQKEVSNFTISEWVAYMPNLISPGMKAQMEVEARAKYSWDNNAAAQEASTEAIDGFNKRIEEIDAIIATTNLSKGEEEKLKKEKTNFQGFIQKTKATLASGKLTATAIGFPTIYNKLVLDNAALVGSDPSLKYKNLPKVSASSAVGVAENLSGRGVYVSDMNTGQMEDITLEGIEAAQQGVRKTTFEWTNRSKEEVIGNIITQQDFDTKVKSYRENNNSVGQKQAETQVILDIYKKNNEYAKLNEGYDLLDKLELQNKVQQERSKTFTQKEVYTDDIEPIFKALIEEGAMNRQKLVIDGKEVSPIQYLKDNGITTKEKLTEFIENPEKSKELRAQITTDMFLNSVSQNVLGGKTNIGTALKSGGRLARVSSEDLHGYTALAETLGKEGRVITDDFKITRGDSKTSDILKNTAPMGKFLPKGIVGESIKMGVGLLGNMLSEEEKELTYDEVVELTKEIKFDSDIKIELREDADPEIRKALEKRLKYTTEESSYTVVQQVLSTERDVATAVFGGDSNFYDDASLRDILSFDSESHKEKYTQALKDAMVSVDTPLKITVSGAVSKEQKEDPIRQQLANVVEDLETASPFRYDNRSPATIYVDPLNPQNVIISQLTEKDTVDKNLAEIQSIKKRKEAIVEMSQFKQLFPIIANQFNLEQDEQKLNFAVDKNTPFTDITYEQGKGEDFENHTNYFQNPSITNRAFAESTKGIFRLNYGDVMQNEKAKMTIEAALKNPSMFKTELKEKADGSFYTKVYFNKNKNAQKEEDKDYELIYDTGNLQQDQSIEKKDILNIMRISPQVFVTYALENLAQDFRQANYEFEEGDSFTSIYKTLLQK